MEGCIRQVSRAFSHSRPFSPALPKPPFFHLRLGQEPPPAPQEDAYDGRSLAEVRSYLSPIVPRISVFIYLMPLMPVRNSPPIA